MPRASRSGVLSKRAIGQGRAAGPMNGRQPMVAVNGNITQSKRPTLKTLRAATLRHRAICPLLAHRTPR